MSVEPAYFFTGLAVILLGLSLHEYAHAKIADAAGDPTPRMFGRVTLNPLNHLDPIGTIMIVVTSLTGFGIGWGRPVPMNPSRMGNPRWDHFAAVAAGPCSNLLQAVLYATVLRILMGTGQIEPGVLRGFLDGTLSPAALFLVFGVLVNVALCFFNLIPLGPLDGHWMLGAFLPDAARMKWYLWNRSVGGFVFLGLVFMGQLLPGLDLIGRYLLPVTIQVFRFLVGE